MLGTLAHRWVTSPASGRDRPTGARLHLGFAHSVAAPTLRDVAAYRPVRSLPAPTVPRPLMYGKARARPKLRCAITGLLGAYCYCPKMFPASLE